RCHGSARASPAEVAYPSPDLADHDRRRWHRDCLPALPFPAAAVLRAADTALRHPQDPDLTGPDRTTRLFHGHAVPAGIVAGRGPDAEPGALGLGCERLRLGAERDPCDPARDELWFSRGSADRARPLHSCCNDVF